MVTLELERPSTVSRTWVDLSEGAASHAYVASLTASNDFASDVIRELRQRVTGLTGYQLLTDLREHYARFANSLAKVPRAVTVDASQNHPDLPRAEARLEFLSNLDLSQSFEDLTSPSKGAVEEAAALLRKLASFSTNRGLPDIGLDSDGYFVFSFAPERTGMVGSLSVFGDGTYSFCVEMEGESVECGAAPISAPIVDDLKAFLTR